MASEMLLAGLAGGMQGLETGLEDLRKRIKETRDKKEKGELLKKYYDAQVAGGMSKEEATAETSSVAMGNAPGTYSTIGKAEIRKSDIGYKTAATGGVIENTRATRLGNNALESEQTGEPVDVTPDFLRHLIATKAADLRGKETSADLNVANTTGANARTGINEFNLKEAQERQVQEGLEHPTDLVAIDKLIAQVDAQTRERVDAKMRRTKEKREYQDKLVEQWTEVYKALSSSAQKYTHEQILGMMDEKPESGLAMYPYLDEDEVWDIFDKAAWAKRGTSPEKLRRGAKTYKEAPPTTPTEPPPDPAREKYEKKVGRRLHGAPMATGTGEQSAETPLSPEEQAAVTQLQELVQTGEAAKLNLDTMKAKNPGYNWDAILKQAGLGQ